VLIYDVTEIPEPYDAVVTTLATVGSELQVWASAAYRRGEDMAVGPAEFVSASIDLEVGSAIQGHETTTIPMSWIATSASALFPRMDAEVVVSPAHSSMTNLEFRGSYRPPLEGVGRLLDRIALHRIAESTVRNFLDRLVSAVTAEIRAIPDETGEDDSEVRRAAPP
jgi:hypothetical protein